MLELVESYVKAPPNFSPQLLRRSAIMSGPEINGSLSAGGRFNRMEQALVRIEDKLDNKVDQADLEIVRRRVELLESGESPLGKVLLQDYAQMKQVLSDITLHGSQNAQAAARQVSDLETQMAKLSVATQTNEAVRQQHREQWDKSYRVWGVLISLISMGSFIVTMVSTLAH